MDAVQNVLSGFAGVGIVIAWIVGGIVALCALMYIAHKIGVSLARANKNLKYFKFCAWVYPFAGVGMMIYFFTLMPNADMVVKGFMGIFLAGSIVFLFHVLPGSMLDGSYNEEVKAIRNRAAHAKLRTLL